MTGEGRRVARRAVEALAAVATAVVLLALGLPRIANATWTQIGTVLGSVPLPWFVLLAAVWLAGLWVHTIVLVAALPGLSHRRAFFLNISGSSVSNVVPLGGALGTAVNWWSCRRWGFTTTAFVRWALVTNIWDVLGRLVVPAVALGWFGLEGRGEGDLLLSAGLGSVAALLAAAALTAFLLRTDVGARRLGAAADRLPVRLHRTAGGQEARAVEMRGAIIELVRHAWPRLTAGKLLYAAAQAALLWLCLAAVGTPPAASVVFAAFAVERVLSLAVVTPGATGFVELGMTAYLVRMGADPASAAAGVLLYRFFVIGMEVPVGGTLLLGWTARQMLHRGVRGASATRALGGAARSEEPPDVPSSGMPISTEPEARVR
ncbi:lysylphosphatidylglycerol synthase domain-containing protein [Pedococcus sp. 2YAF34]|uniref:lysylphosphatidylglycerol synthase domain-containing protein n=1 Tax=Pedococcus sp. 2YAF34 TaxID=3233032 RepID=UPI003F9A14D6